MTVKLYIHKLLYETRHSDLRSRYSSEVELLCPFWLSLLLVDCSCWYLIRRQFTCLLKTTTRTDCIFHTHPSEARASHLLCDASRNAPHSNRNEWELRGPGATPTCSPASVCCTVVICGCISLLPVLSSLRKCMLYSALIPQHLAQCLAESKC